MARVLATMQNGAYADAYASQMSDLATWINEILSAAFSQINPVRFQVSTPSPAWRADFASLRQNLDDEPLAELLPRNWFEVR